ncbi:MAG: zinc ribbon domain-containing protein [Alphaproteobacteria bacterium]
MNKKRTGKTMKKCPFCAEEIQDAAIKCKHCSEFLEERKPAVKWYFKKPFVIFCVLTLGPFGLPLVWYHPKYNKKTKIIVSSIVMIITYLVMQALDKAFQEISAYYQMLY